MRGRVDGEVDVRMEAARRWLRRLAAGTSGLGEGLLIVVAHADDEVIGVGGQLAWTRGVRLLHVTDSAPRNLFDARAAGFERSQDYAAARRAELLAALGLVGIEARCRRTSLVRPTRRRRSCSPSWPKPWRPGSAGFAPRQS